jgi:hypothetical protein
MGIPSGKTIIAQTGNKCKRQFPVAVAPVLWENLYFPKVWRRWGGCKKPLPP